MHCVSLRSRREREKNFQKKKERNNKEEREYVKK